MDINNKTLKRNQTNKHTYINPKRYQHACRAMRPDVPESFRGALGRGRFPRTFAVRGIHVRAGLQEVLDDL
eukprot:5737400-Heterocapsa_arctica.AAC.1